jgi:K+-sensing histidine kinase KdpD
VATVPAWLRTDTFAAWGFAAAAFLAALVLRFAFAEVLPEGFPYLTFYPAILATAFLAGLGPSVGVTVASTLAAWYFFLPPTWSFRLEAGETLTLGISWRLPASVSQ